MDLTSSIGLDKIQKAAALILATQVNSMIATVNAMYAITDATWYAGMTLSDPQYSAETIPGDNIYAGHVPSLIEAPVAKYPNLACIANQAQPQSSTDDWAEMYTVTLAIEIMCKSEIVPPEKEARAQLEVNARVQRTMEAVHAVLSTETNRTLGNTVPKIASTPQVIVSDVFARREEKSRGDRWFWQGARLEYAVDKYSGYDH